MNRQYSVEEALKEDLELFAKDYSELLRKAVEDIRIAATSESICEVCAHNVECKTCVYYEDLCCEERCIEFGKCPNLAMTPCSGCDYEKGTNFLWRGYMKNGSKS